MRDIIYGLMRMYSAAGRPVTKVHDQMKMGAFVANGDTHKICDQDGRQ